MHFTVFSLLLFASLAAAQLPVTNGGTGANSASGARTNLGAAASTDTPGCLPAPSCSSRQEPAQLDGRRRADSLASTSSLRLRRRVMWAQQAARPVTRQQEQRSANGGSLTAAAQTFTGSSVTSGATSAGTPAGTNTLGGFAEGAISWPANPPTFTGTPFTDVINHTHTVTVNYKVQGGTTAATAGTHVMTSTATGRECEKSGKWRCRFQQQRPILSGGVSSITPAGTISYPANVPTIGVGTFTQPTFTGSLMGTHTHSVTAAGTNGTSAVTGTLAPGAFTGTPATIQPPYVKLIPCSKN